MQAVMCSHVVQTTMCSVIVYKLPTTTYIYISNVYYPFICLIKYFAILFSLYLYLSFSPSCFTQLESTEFEMVTGFLQGFVENEKNLNPDNSCKNTCGDFRITRQYGCLNDTACGLSIKNQRITKCKGVLRDCEYISSNVEICPSVSNK